MDITTLFDIAMREPSILAVGIVLLLVLFMVIAFAVYGFVKFISKD